MSGSIRIYDTTLREGFAGVGAAVSVDQAVAIARALEKAGVSAIEAGYPAQSPVQRDIVRAVAGAVSVAEVAALASCDAAETAAAVDAVRQAAKPLVHLYLSARAACDASGRVELCRAIEDAVAAVRAAGIEVQFSIAGMEAMERPFRRQCIGVAVNAGATRIAVPDSTGAMETAAYAEMVRDIVQFVGPRATVSAHCHNASGRAVQNALAGIEAGATQVETTVQGIGPSGGNTALEDIAGQIRGRAGTCGVDRRAVAAIAALTPATQVPEQAEGVCAARDTASAPVSCPVWYCRVEVATL